MQSNPCVRTCRKKMKRLRKSNLPQMLSNPFYDIPGGVKILHSHIGNLRRKMKDIKDDFVKIQT